MHSEKNKIWNGKSKHPIPDFFVSTIQRNKKQHFFEKYLYAKAQPASLGILFVQSSREDDGMVTQVKVVTDFYYDSDRTAYCDTTTVIYEGKFPW